MADVLRFVRAIKFGKSQIYSESVILVFQKGDSMAESSNRKTVYDSDCGPKYVLEDSGTMKRVVEEKKTSAQRLAVAGALGAGVAAAAGGVISAPVVAAAAVCYGLYKLFKR